MTGKLESKLDYKIFLWGLLFLPALVLPVISFFRKAQEGFIVWETEAKNLLLPFAILLVTAITIWYYRTRVPQIIISQNYIQFGNRVIFFNQIQDINVLAKGFLTFEKSILYLNNFEEIHLAISLYQNGPLLRYNLEYVQKKLKGETYLQIPILQTQSVKPEKLSEPSYIRKYKQPIYSNYFFYFATGFSGMMFFFAIKIAKFSIALMVLLPLILICFILLKQYFYFLISDNHITIKNFFMPWYQKSFLKSDIILARKYWGGKGADGIKLIFSDYTTKVFQSHLISEKMLQEIISKLNSNNVQVIK